MPDRRAFNLIIASRNGRVQKVHTVSAFTFFMKTQQDIIKLIEADDWMMRVLRAVATLQLPDWWIGAGFIRAKVWDTLHGYTKRTPLGDIDVIYFDPADINEAAEKQHEAALKKLMPAEPWSVKNQARMHLVNGDKPYTSSEDALSRWPDTPTCIGARLSPDGHVILTAPHGISDLITMTVRPSPAFMRDLEVYRKRLSRKNWPKKWPRVKIL